MTEEHADVKRIYLNIIRSRAVLRMSHASQYKQNTTGSGKSLPV
jgi:hypothetical protein